MKKIEMNLKHRLCEIFCVIFGHSWDEYGSIKGENGVVLEEHSKCSCCNLENHDRSGYGEVFDTATR